MLQVVPFPERYGGIPERAAAEERESRKGMAQPIACRVSAVIPEMSCNKCFRVDQGSPVGLWDGGAILAIIIAEEVDIEI